jgi:hypothetical protein
MYIYGPSGNIGKRYQAMATAIAKETAAVARLRGFNVPNPEALSGPPTKYVEVYGTLPEAQQYVAEEFDLPVLPPTSVLVPPLTMKKPYTRTIAILPQKQELGIDQIEQQTNWYQKYKNPMIIGGVALGVFALAKILKSSRFERNPDIKDPKLQVVSLEGGIPTNKGKIRLIDPAKVLPEKHQQRTPFIEECLAIKPDVLETGKKPYLRLPEDQQEKAIQSLMKTNLSLLRAGWKTVSPPKWVGPSNLFGKFRSFYHLGWLGYTAKKPVIKLAFKLWKTLGMPGIGNMTANSKRIIKKILRTHGDKATKYVQILDKAESTFGNNPQLIWQLIAISNIYLFNDANIDNLLNALLSFGKESWRVRWWINSKLQGRFVQLRPNWQELKRDKTIPEKEFIKKYGVDPVLTWARLHGRIPKDDILREIPPNEIASLPFKFYLRAYKSPELKKMLDERTKEALEETRASLLHDLAYQRKRKAKAVKRWKAIKQKGGRKKQLANLWGNVVMASRDVKRIERLLKDKESKKQLALDIEHDTMPDIVQAAQGLSVVFGPNWKQWLKRMTKRGIDVHDATHWLPTVDKPGLGKYLFSHWQAPIGDLSTIATGWDKLTEEERRLPVQQVKAVIAARVYKDAKHQDFALEAAKWGIPEEIYHKIEDKWLRSVARKEKSRSTIPDIELEHGGYKIYKLDDDDPRGLFLGNITNCCQHPLGVGAQSAWHGVGSPKGGFYVVEDPENRIIAESWVWRPDNHVVFDSVESKGLGPKRNNLVVKLYEALSKAMLQKEPQIKDIRIGYSRGLEVPPTWEKAEQTVSLPKGYKGYSDARTTQRIIASSQPNQ